MVKYNSNKTNNYDHLNLKLSHKLNKQQNNSINDNEDITAPPMTCINRQKSQIINYDSVMKIKNAYEVIIGGNAQSHNFDQMESSIF